MNGSKSLLFAAAASGQPQKDVPTWRRSPRCYKCGCEWPAALLAVAQTMPVDERALVCLTLRATDFVRLIPDSYPCTERTVEPEYLPNSYSFGPARPWGRGCDPQPPSHRHPTQCPTRHLSSPSGAAMFSTTLKPTTAKDSRKHWKSAGEQQAWWGWVSKPRACRVSALCRQPPCRSVAPPPAAWPHSSSTAPAPGRAMGAGCPGAGTPPAWGTGRGNRSRCPPGLRWPWQGPSPQCAGQTQGGSLGRRCLSSVCFSSLRKEEGLWGPGAPRRWRGRPLLAGSGPAAALPRRRQGAVASSWAPGLAWRPRGFAPAKPVPQWGSPPPRLSAAPSRRQPRHGRWDQVPQAGGHGPGPQPPCATRIRGVCWGGTVGSVSTSEKTFWAASASIFCGQPTGDKGPIYPELLWCRWRPGWRSSVGFLPRCLMPSHWMRCAEFPMKSL